MDFKPGFRVSKLDVGVIFIALTIAAYLYNRSVTFGFIVLFVVFHFFLFCNVIRMSRIPELIWASIFSALAILSLRASILSWNLSVALTLMATLVLVVFELRKPSYHGFLWQKINPNLPVWFSKKQGALAKS